MTHASAPSLYCSGLAAPAAASPELAGNDLASVADDDEIHHHILETADELSNGIIRAFPQPGPLIGTIWATLQDPRRPSTPASTPRPSRRAP